MTRGLWHWEGLEILTQINLNSYLGSYTEVRGVGEKKFDRNKPELKPIWNFFTIYVWTQYCYVPSYEERGSWTGFRVQVYDIEMSDYDRDSWVYDIESKFCYLNYEYTLTFLGLVTLKWLAKPKWMRTVRVPSAHVVHRKRFGVNPFPSSS